MGRTQSTTRRRMTCLALAAGAAVVTAATALPGAAFGRAEGKTISVAIVKNPQMTDIAALTPSLFTAKTGIKVKYTILDEGKLREITTRDVGSGGKSFDAVMIGMYETPQFGEAGLLQDLTPLAKADAAYKFNDVLPAVRNGLSANGKLYASPFYAESSFLMYRKDVLAAAGQTMPAKPTWDQVAAIARKVNTPNLAGICLRGKPGWGDLGASFTTVLNTFGGTWWSSTASGKPAAAQVNQPQFKTALDFYSKLVQDAGEKDAANSSFNECLAQYQAGKVAMWYDATVAAGLGARDPEELARRGGRLEVHRLGDRPRLHQGRRYPHQGRLGGDPAGHARLDLPDPAVQEGSRGLRVEDAGSHERRADQQPRHDQTPRPARRAVRRHPPVPGCR
jgi:sorbitol/mannitol transport system substrate-binding protein